MYESGSHQLGEKTEPSHNYYIPVLYPRTMARKFIIDCDAGVDDAMALLLAIEAHKRDEIEVVAITAVQGNTTVPNVIVNILRVLDVAQCPNIPVFRGSDEALVHERSECEKYHGNDGFNDVEFDTKPNISRVQEESGVIAIARLVHENPGEVTVVALGPLTNLALVFKLYPDVPAQIKELFIMGGNIEGIGNSSMTAEFNFFADPEAAFVVLDKTQCPTFLATWELCYKYCKVEMDWRKYLGTIDTPQAELMNKLEKVWFEDYQFEPNHHIQCDQLAMIAALDRNAMVKTQRHWATIELGGSFTRGQMILEQRHQIRFSPDFKPNITVIEQLDEEVLKHHLLRAFGHGNGASK